MRHRHIGMFAFMNNNYVQLMLKMSKEKHTDAEKEEILSQFEELDQKIFIDLCKEHEFEGIIASFLKRNSCEMSKEWEKIYYDCYKRAWEKLNAAKEICELMYSNKIEMILLKNAGILADLIDDPAKMPMGDIDSLIKRKDFLNAHKLMILNGFSFEYSNAYELPDISNAYRDGGAEYVKMITPTHKLVYEVAWRVIAGRWIRPDCEPDTDEVFNRCHYAKDSFVGILSPIDNLLQVCIHTAKHSYLRAPGLRLHLDVERIVNNCKIDWSLFIENVKKAHTKTAVYYSLYIANVFFGTPIPKYILDELRPSRRKQKIIEKMLEKACFLYPKEKKFSRLDYIRLQTSLYDSLFDAWHVLYPNMKWMKMRYNFKNNLLVPFYIIVRGFDIMGIRFKKK